MHLFPTPGNRPGLFALLGRRASSVAILTAGLVSLTIPYAIAETKVHGVLSKDVKWTLEGSPYILDGDVVVARGVRLFITPGVTVLAASNPLRDKAVQQYDHLDSFTTALKVEGILECVGKREKRIVFQPVTGVQWYGIVFNKASDQYCEIAYCDITGANFGITVFGCGPLVRNCVIEHNNVGVNCLENGNGRIYNCVIVGNLTAGVKTQSANPVFYNNIIAFNRNNGVWCDGISRLTFQYNCVWGNSDGNFLECDPELGVALPADKKKTVVQDNAHNICADPVFAGSESDSLAVENDLSLPTEKSRIADTALAKILHAKLIDSLAVKKRATIYARYSLSKYSPCIRTGNPAKEFRNVDGSRGDMGIYGGP
ncbi:MAG TPA: right-handed parallel beta-helix repeat-containing protein [Chitinivibrionales bacterium]